MSFKDNLKAERERNKLTRSEMAKKLNMTPTAYGAYELGKREPKLEKLCDIADILHTSPTQLLGYIPNVLDEAVRDLEKCGFIVALDKKKLGEPATFSILSPTTDENGGDQSYMIDRKTLVSLYKEIPTTSPVLDAKRDLYIKAFKSIQGIQLDWLVEQIKNNPKYAEAKEVLLKINPDFFKNQPTNK